MLLLFKIAKIIKQIKPNTMTTKFHLLLERNEYTCDHDISKLEPLLKEFAISEGEKTFKKTDVVSIKDANDYMKEELWIDNNTYQGEQVTFIHWYNEQFYIIQTN